jgi:cation transporter-like permease
MCSLVKGDYAEWIDVIDQLPVENKWVVAGGISGAVIGGALALELTEALREEAGLGGELFGYFVLAPTITISSSVIGGLIGHLAQRRLAPLFATVFLLKG